MVLDLSWLSYTVPTPVWALLTLAGYQKALAMMGRARSTEDRKEASGDGDEDGSMRPGNLRWGRSR